MLGRWNWYLPSYEERRAARNGAIAVEYVEKPAPSITLDDHIAAVLGSPPPAATSSAYSVYAPKLGRWTRRSGAA